MANQFSPELLAQLYSANSEDPLLTLFTLDHETFDAPIYLVNNGTDIVSNGITYSRFPVRLVLPQDDGESERVVQVTFDNVSLELLDDIRTVTTPINLKLELVLASIPDEVQMSYEELKLVQVSYNLQTISAKIIPDDFLNTSLTSEKYAPTNFPGLF